MSERENTRRQFLTKGTSLTVGALAAGSLHAQTTTPARQDEAQSQNDSGNKFTSFSRYEPSYGGPPDSDDYLGKLVTGLRAAGQEPVPFTTPDLGKIPWEMVNGRKEYHINCEHVIGELLPGHWMDFFGFNGSMPGPTIEAFQGDKVRFVVHNKLPEPTSVHWHGLELPVDQDGVPGVTQDPIKPGGTFVYEFDLHQTGTFFYHSHMPMQEAFGMVGFFIIHPRVDWDPPVDRDIGLLFQNFRIDPNQTVPDSMSMDWNWHTINGRSGPYTTPLVVKHGERVRIRILDFSPQQHHPIHMHGHTFWVTGHEGARIPKSAWVPRNTELIAVAQGTDYEFIAFNPGDWLLHCHMVHHMMNHMVRQVGPRIREDIDTMDYKTSINNRPRVKLTHAGDPKFDVPGYPQMMQSQGFTEEAMKQINARRETKGMRKMWHMGVKGLMTVIRVLPEDLYQRVMESDEKIEHGEIFDEIVRRRKKKDDAKDSGKPHG